MRARKWHATTTMTRETTRFREKKNIKRPSFVEGCKCDFLLESFGWKTGLLLTRRTMLGVAIFPGTGLVESGRPRERGHARVIPRIKMEGRVRVCARIDARDERRPYPRRWLKSPNFYGGLSSHGAVAGTHSCAPRRSAIILTWNKRRTRVYFRAETKRRCPKIVV